MTNNLSTRCQALTKNGQPCRAAAMEGGLCFFHANPNKVSELGRIGGLKNRSIPAEPVAGLADVNTATGVRDIVGRLITDVYSGKLHPRIGAGLAPLLNLQLRVIETSDVERRLAQLEKQLAEYGAGDRDNQQKANPGGKDASATGRENNLTGPP